MLLPGFARLAAKAQGCRGGSSVTVDQHLTAQRSFFSVNAAVPLISLHH